MQRTRLEIIRFKMEELVSKIHENVIYLKQKSDNRDSYESEQRALYKSFVNHLGTIAGAIENLEKAGVWVLRLLVAGFGVMVCAIVAISIVAMIAITKVDFLAKNNNTEIKISSP
jgi:hypothetical protein